MKKYNLPLKSVDAILMINEDSKVRNYFWAIIGSLLVFLFLPWTQNIKSKGNITTLNQSSRPQNINSPIPGRISSWYVREGDFVKKGDTILILSEIKEDYLDPNLVGRTKEQVDAKVNAIDFYQSKVKAVNAQVGNLMQAKRLKIAQLENKLKQLENKLAADKADLIAIENEYKLLENQYERQLKMFKDGLVSQTQLQERSVKFQNATAKRISAENKVAQTQQDIINNRLEQNSAEQEYTEKINKAQGEKFQNLSEIATSSAEVAKLENQLMNYTIRNGMYILTAPQDGQIVQANKSGIGEILKEGETVSVIVPSRVDFAVEMFVKPMDLPLINKGQSVRFTFDGFPAIVFSGWPQTSYGTFGGKIVAIENTIGPNGMYRVLVEEDANYKKWPKQLMIGTGANSILLLKNVPIWYEMWRNINGFPLDFYTGEVEPKKKK